MADAGAVWEGMDPLLLTDRMRTRLRVAVGELLADPALDGAPESVQAAAVVLMAKTNAADLAALVTARELGRWLGISDSAVRHTVRPWLQRGVVFSVDEVPPGSRRTTSIRWEVQRLVEARRHGSVDDPLRLTRPELTALLRVCEELFAPGWGSRPGGLLVRRIGHDAAGDRLAALLAVLHGRPDGSVPMCPGAVDRHGREAATLARLLGQDSAAGARRLARLEAYEVLARQPGMRERLVVPAVARAYRRMRQAARAAGRVPGPRGVGGSREAAEGGAATAGGDQNPALAEKLQVSRGDEAVPEGGASAALHATHSTVGPEILESAADLWLSGAAACGPGDLPGCARVREDQLPADAPSGSSPQVVDGAGGPLRGEEPNEAITGLTRAADPLPPGGSGGELIRDAGARPAPGQVANRRLREGVPRPPDDLAWVFGPVMYLWERLDRGGARAVVVTAARRELRLLAGIGERVDPAAGGQLLAERLARRWREQREPVNDPVGWLLGRGLVRRPTCSDIRCDDGMRMDTGRGCPLCERKVTDRRGDRHRIAQEVAAALPDATPREWWVAFEQQLRRFVEEQLAGEQARREQAAAERRLREQEEARRLELAAAADAARQAQPCTGCGRAASAGWCAVCEQQRACREAIDTAAVTAAAAWAVLDDPAGVDAIVEHAEAEVTGEVERQQTAARAKGAVPETLAVLAKLTAQTAADGWARDAVEHLQRTDQAVREGELAYAAAMRSIHLRSNREVALREAATAAAAARRRAAELLLKERIAVLRARRSVTAGAPVVSAAGTGGGGVMACPGWSADAVSETYARGADRVRAAMRAAEHG